MSRQDVHNIKALNSYCWNKPFYDELTARSMGEAVIALEKQIPKSIIYSGDGYADGEMVYDMANCPYCDKYFEEYETEWNCNYCPNCGQKLDWTMNERNK